MELHEPRGLHLDPVVVLEHVGVDALPYRAIMPNPDSDTNDKEGAAVRDYDLCIGNIFHQHFRDGELFAVHHSGSIQLRFSFGFS